MGTDSPAFILNEKEIIKSLEIDCPSARKLADGDIDQLKTLKPVKANKLECTQVMFPGHFKLKVIIQADSKDPLTLLMVINKVGKQQDKNQMGEVNILDSDKFSKHTQKSMAWLWAASKGLIPEI